MTVLTTERLDMRPPQKVDLPAYQAFYAVTDLTVGNYRGGRSEAEVAAIHRADMAEWTARGWGMFLLRRTGADAVLGGVGLADNPDWDMTELTWWLMPAARGKGFATEAARVVIDWAYDVLGWARVQTFMRVENQASRAIAERLGGVHEGQRVFPDGALRDLFFLPHTRDLAPAEVPS